MKKTLTALVGTGILLFSTAALAQQQPQQGGGQYGWQGSYSPTAPPARNSSVDNIGAEQQFVFGVDRVMGVAWDRNKQSTSPDETTTAATSVALLGAGSAASSLMPRLALDFFPIEGFSIGGSFVYWNQSISIDRGSASADGPTTTDIIFHPRIGYAYAFDETFGIWPRAGITWYSHKVKQPAIPPSTKDLESKQTGFNITAEIPIVISPVENFAFLIGPYIEIPLSGTRSDTGLDDVDSKTLSLGLTVSVLGYY